jgi:hypothetical protein
MLQILFVDIHGLQEVLFLQMCHAIQSFIFQGVTTPYVRGANSGGAWEPSAQKGFQLAEIIWSGLPQLSQN